MKESLSLLGLPMWVGLLYLLLGFASVKAEWHGELSFRSDYVYRGYSKSQGDPVVQGLIDYQSKSGFFGGLGLSQVNFNDNANANRAQLEIKPYLGGIIPLSVDWRAELSVSGYLYNGNVFGQNGDYAEFGASLHYQDWLSAKIAVAPNAYQRHTTVPSYELGYRRDIFDSVQFSGGGRILPELGLAGAGLLLLEHGGFLVCDVLFDT